ncbi:MAG: hypothetical protein L3K23_08255 [Thermoplasmata archaeon]|nr:hypothetical protein [Thermoplasmata archaeon]
MTAQLRRAERLEEPVPAERTTPTTPSGVDCLGHVRVPLTVAHRPWATLHRGPTGETYWTLRLWSTDRAVPTRVTTDELRAYARINRLRSLADAIDELLARAGGVDADRR